MKVYNIIKTLISRDKAFRYLILALINGTLGIIFGLPISFVVCALLLFSIFDVYGFHYLTRAGWEGMENLERTATYRVIQSMFMVYTVIILLLIAPWHAAAMFFLCWWLGFCDYLYYDILKQMDYMKSEKDMHWLWWTPYGLALNIFNKPIPNIYLRASFIIANILLIIYGILT